MGEMKLQAMKAIAWIQETQDTSTAENLTLIKEYIAKLQSEVAWYSGLFNASDEARCVYLKRLGEVLPKEEVGQLIDRACSQKNLAQS
jgi:hypothetical protein